jgi:hypothetical protein
MSILLPLREVLSICLMFKLTAMRRVNKGKIRSLGGVAAREG